MEVHRLLQDWLLESRLLLWRLNLLLGLVLLWSRLWLLLGLVCVWGRDTLSRLGHDHRHTRRTRAGPRRSLERRVLWRLEKRLRLYPGWKPAL